jgi:hypothetical protein
MGQAEPMTSQWETGRPANVGDDLRHVRDHTDVQRVVERMRADLLEHPDEWENPTLERYLAGLSALIRDVDGLLSNRGEQLPERPSWALIAELLVGGTGYE